MFAALAPWASFSGGASAVLQQHLTPMRKQLPDLIFGQYPEILGGEGQYIMLERASAVAASRAFRCRTWGEFAEVAGLPWKRLHEEWGEDYAEQGVRKRTLRPTSRFRYADIAFGLTTGPALPHPAEVASELVHASPYVRDYIIARRLEFEPGTPWGNLECILAPSCGPFLALQEYLSRERRDRWTLDHDDRLVRRGMRGGR